MEETEFDIIVIGAGIVGLATALAATKTLPSLKIAILEKEHTIGLHQSGHNSGVIHSGIYYRPGSLKARNCVEGANAIIGFCEQHGIDFQICGKVIVATDKSEIPALHELMRRGQENNVQHLELIDSGRLADLEPNCAGVAALCVPTAGITDYKSVTAKYAELIRRNGGSIFTDCKVSAIKPNANSILIKSGDRAMHAKAAINCAGLHSDRVMRLAGSDSNLQIIPFRGEYYKLKSEKQHLVRNLIYPVPNPDFPFLGVHFTRHIEGFVEAGPNAVLSMKREGYAKTAFSFRDAMDIATYPGFWRLARKHWSYGVEEMYRSFSKSAFTRSLRKLLPSIQPDDLEPAGAGVRAQALDTDGNLLDDFVIVPEGRVVHVCNVPSPAATASLIIGRQIIEMTARRFELPMLKG